MKDKAQKPIYEQRFKKYTSITRVSTSINNFKYFVLQVIASSFFKRLLFPGDLYLITKQPTLIGDPDESLPYLNVELTRVDLFEALAIDDFDKSIILKRFRKHMARFGQLDRAKAAEKLDEIKSSLDSVQYGGELFHITFGQEDKENDLLQLAIVTYFKTPESYIILAVEVVPSQKFNKIFKDIVHSKNYQKNTIAFNNFWTLARSGRFISHQLVGGRGGTAVSYSYENLLKDLVYQIKKNITNHLKGHFVDSDYMPCIEHFVVDDMDRFKQSINASEFVDLRQSFKMDDEKVFIEAKNTFNTADFRIKIVKEKGHGKRATSPNDLTNYDWVETHHLIKNLSMPYTLLMIMRNHVIELNELKRRIYDFITYHSPNRRRRRLKFRMNRNSYVDLKMLLVNSILTFKRFAKEFGPGGISCYLDADDLKQYKLANVDLYQYFQESISKNVERLNDKLDTLESIFKPMEDLNVYRTNVLLQRYAIIISIIALLNVGEVFSTIKVFFSHLWTAIWEFVNL